MEDFSGDKDEHADDITGRKKSRLKSLKTRLFRKSKRSGEAGGAKLSQSESDITAAECLGSDEDLACAQGMIGSRALSHDSIFLTDQVETEAQPTRVLSQENVHSKIKALQVKLQQQKMPLGPPPMVVPIRRPEDLGTQSEDRKAPSPPELPAADFTSQMTPFKMVPQSGPHPLSPTVRPAATKPPSPTPSHSVPLSASSHPPSSSVEPPLDFSTPAQFTACLDSSAARHRMLVKPRNQRASTKKKPPVVQASSESESTNNPDISESVEEGEQQPDALDEVTAEEEDVSSSQNLPFKSAEVAAVTPEAAAKPAHSSQQEHALPQAVPPAASQVLRPKPHRHVDVTAAERPHSSHTESESDGKKEGDLEIQAISQEKKSTVNKPGPPEVSSNQLPASPVSKSSVHKQAQAEDESPRGLSRPAPGSGSFHFSITTARNRDAERPRAGSFVGVLEQIESWQKTSKENEEKATREKEECKGFQPRGGLFTVGRLKPDAGPPKSSVTPRDKRDSLRRGAAKSTDSDTAEGGEARTSQEGVEVVEVAEEAKELQEEEGKISFGVRLRSTSQSIRQRSESCSKTQSKTALPEDQCDTQRRRDTSMSVSERLQTNISYPTSSSRELRPTGPDASSLFPDNPPIPSAEVQAAVEATPKEQEPQPAPQTSSSSEVSWMSLAMEKTRSLQQLFTSRFPMQTAGRSPAPQQPASLTETQTQSAKTQQGAAQLQAANQPSADPVKAEAAQSGSKAVKPPAAGQQKTPVASPDQPHPLRELHMSKQTSEDQPQLNTSQSAWQPHPAVQTNPWTTQSTLRSSSHTEATTQSPVQSHLASGQQQPSWSSRGLHPAAQLKATAAAPPSGSAAASPTERVDREAVMLRDSPSLSSRRAVWTGSVSDRAALLERRAEWKPAPGPNGVELRRTQTEVQTSAEPPSVSKITPPSKDTAPEGRQGVKLRESSPTKIPEKLREDKWPRRGVVQTSSPSSSPTMPSVLQSMSDSGQPSWMELAKRKSMAWSDKTMD